MPSDLWPAEALSKTLAAYEARPQQVEMAAAVADAAEGGGVLFAEAGTGVGKTLAYLVPGIRHALATGNPLVVATSTINLQSQIIDKDLPLLREVLFPDLRVALLKGKANYLCLEEFASVAGAGEEEGLFDVDPAAAPVLALEKWAGETKDGSKETLPFDVPFWSHVNCDTPICQSRNCPQYGDCFYYRARERLEKAHVIVANHHYLMHAVGFSDEGGEFKAEWIDAVLPSPSLLVVDEAHSFEGAARDSLTFKSGTAALSWHLNRLVGSRRKTRGLIPHLRKRLRKRKELERLDSLAREVADARAKVAEAVEWLDTLKGEAGFPFRLGKPREGAEEAFEAASRETAAGLAQAAERLANGLVPIKNALTKLAKEADDKTAAKAMWERLGGRVAGAMSLADHADALQSASQGEAPAGTVSWVDRLKRQSRPRPVYEWHLVPLEVDTPLASLWKATPSVVFSSATLTVAGDPSPIRKRLGVPAARAAAVTLDSPFDYAAACRHVVVKGVGPYEHPRGNQAHAKRLAPVISQAIAANQGRALVLFTSYRLLRLVADLVAPRLAKANISLLRHGDEGRSTLLRRFADEQPAALFGTDSFWQGVDIPGPTLSLLIITRLPFTPPDNPLYEARQEAYEASGRNYWQDVAVPEAVTRYRQGFGRLIRTQQDTGTVLTLDDRLLTKGYGRAFLSSLPSGLRNKALPPLGTSRILMSSKPVPSGPSPSQ